MKLSAIINRVQAKAFAGNATLKDAAEISMVAYDSRKVEASGLFVAITGFKQDGNQFVASAIKNGAITIVGEKLPETIDPKVLYIVVEDARLALAQIAKAFYNDASDKLKLVGVTGTNGKTTTTTLMKSILDSNGIKSGLIGTIGYHIGAEFIEADRTTPEALELHAMFDKMVKAGCTVCVMEVSSHSLELKRTAGLRFDVAVFTNLTQDHLDFHGTMQNYFETKKMLFDGLGENAVAITNTDDSYGKKIVATTKAKVKTYRVENGVEEHRDEPTDVLAKVLGFQLEATSAILFANGEPHTHSFRFIGKFNLYNILAAYSVGVEFGIAHIEIIRGIMRMKGVRGRMEQVWSKSNRAAIVDYAHTPDALFNVIRAIKEIKPKEGKLITVFGCGGDRDKTKRPQMGKIADADSDVVIITSDNPRSESPESILNDIEAGMKKRANFYRIENREDAIRKGITLLDRGDVLLVAGKGHESYQEVDGVKYYFDDKEFIEQVFREQEG